MFTQMRHLIWWGVSVTEPDLPYVLFHLEIWLRIRSISHSAALAKPPVEHLKKNKEKKVGEDGDGAY